MSKKKVKTFSIGDSVHWTDFTTESLPVPHTVIDVKSKDEEFGKETTYSIEDEKGKKKEVFEWEIN